MFLYMEVIEKREAGRPQKPIDWDEVDKHLQNLSSGQEIADCFGIHRDTLYDRCVLEKGMLFSEYSATQTAKGLVKLREWQRQKAEKLDSTMLIWLGKNWLKQTDTQKDKDLPAEIITAFTEVMAQLKANQEAKRLEKEASESVKTIDIGASDNVEST